MSNQYLKPFKAKFILQVKTTMKNFFVNPDEISLIDKYSKVTDKIGNVDISKFIQYYTLGFSRYNEYKNLHLKYHQAFDIHPENVMNNDERDSQLTFKLESFEVEVLQIIDSKITFVNSEKDVHTIEINEDLALQKV